MGQRSPPPASRVTLLDTPKGTSEHTLRPKEHGNQMVRIMSSLHIFLRLAAFAAALALLYIAFFLYEDEEGGLKNRLEELWVKIDDLQKKSLSRNAAFLSGASRIAIIVLNRIFGERSVSLQSVRSCIIFSFASTAFAFALVFAFVLLFIAWHAGDVTVFSRLVLAGLLFATIGAMPAFTQNKLVHFASYIAAGLLAITPFFFLPRIGVPYVEVSLVLSGSIAADIAFIRFLRWLLRKVVVATKAAVMCVGLLLSLAVAMLLNLPFYYLLYFESVKLFVLAGYVKAHPEFLQRPLSPEAVQTFLFFIRLIEFSIVFSTNTLDAACALLVFVLMFFTLMHRLLWPILERPIYAAQRWNLVSNSTVLAALGFAALVFALPPRLGHALAAIKNLVPALK
jgi:hypothetical protein